MNRCDPKQEIPPKSAFRHTFSSGADFVPAGMYDFEIAEDAKIAIETLVLNQDKSANVPGWPEGSRRKASGQWPVIGYPVAVVRKRSLSFETIQAFVIRCSDY